MLLTGLTFFLSSSHPTFQSLSNHQLWKVETDDGVPQHILSGYLLILTIVKDEWQARTSYKPVFCGLGNILRLYPPDLHIHCLIFLSSPLTPTLDLVSPKLLVCTVLYTSKILSAFWNLAVNAYYWWGSMNDLVETVKEGCPGLWNTRCKWLKRGTVCILYGSWRKSVCPRLSCPEAEWFGMGMGQQTFGC